MSGRGNFQDFLENKIIVNGKEYDRGSFSLIATDFNRTIEQHPIFKPLHSIVFDDVRINGIDCSYASIEAEGEKIIDVIMTPNMTGSQVAVFASHIDCEPSYYQTPLGRACDYFLDAEHKISLSNGFMVYIWTDETADKYVM